MRGLAAVALLATLAACGGTRGAVARGAVPFTQLRYEPQMGFVGRAFSATLTLREEDSPTGFPCSVRPYGGSSVRGQLPPGVQFDGARFGYHGTPTRAGTYTSFVDLRDLRCTAGSDTKSYGDRNIAVVIVIQ